MKRIYVFATLLAIFALSVTFYSCEKNASGRSTLSLVDDGTMMSMAEQQYAAFLNENPPVTGTPQAAMVQRVGAGVKTGVERYLAEIGQTDLIKNYTWEFNLVNSPEVNAWCMPGGKIVVYTGMMNIATNDNELAVVMGHEVAHAVLKHGNERMSQQLIAEYGGVALLSLLSSRPAEMQQLFNTVFGVGTTLGSLAFSRNQESESDEAGLYYMALGKYDPNAAVTFWQKMQAQGGSGLPEFLNSHPSDNDRIANIKEHMPKAMEYYNRN